jgi:uncharacterized membrane protein
VSKTVTDRLTDGQTRSSGILSPVSRQPGARRRLADLSGTSPERLAGISDGIFSVGMTLLLVLGLVVPTLNGSSTTGGQLWEALRHLGPNLLVYTLSFMTLGIFWLGQGTQLGQLARSNRNYAWIQLLFLFAVTMVPFSTLLLARYYWLQVALIEYWLNIVLLGASLLASLEYGLRAHLFREEGTHDLARLMRGRILIAQSLYAVATLLSMILPTWVSIALIILIQLNYVLAPRIPILGRF